MAISAFGRFWLCASTTKSTALWQKSAVRPSLAQNARTSFSALAPSAHFFTSNVNSSNLTPFHEGAPATSLGQPVEAARARTERRAPGRSAPPTPRARGDAREGGARARETSRPRTVCIESRSAVGNARDAPAPRAERLRTSVVYRSLED